MKDPPNVASAIAKARNAAVIRLTESHTVEFGRYLREELELQGVIDLEEAALKRIAQRGAGARRRRPHQSPEPGREPIQTPTR